MRFVKLAGAALLSLAGIASLLACSSDTGTGEGSGETNSALAGSSDNDHTAFTFFVGKGLTATQSAAIVGNLDQESSMDPTSVQKGGPGRGIAQWSVNGRWVQEKSFAQSEGGSSTDLQVQLDFVWQELSTNAAYGLADLQAATDLTSAVEIFQDKYEICGKCNNGSRVTFAQRALSAFGSEAADVQPSTDGTQTPSSTDGSQVTPTDATNTNANASNGGTFTDNGTQSSDDTDDGPCSVGGMSGECISTSSCAAEGGTSTAGYCPGATNIQCCTFGTMAGDDDDDDSYGYAH